MINFDIEERVFISSIIEDYPVSRVALIRKIMQIKATCDRKMADKLGRTVRKLCIMTDAEYKEYDFSVY